VTTAPSLVRRTVGYLIPSHFLAFVIGWFVTSALGLAGMMRYDMSLDELALPRVRSLVTASLSLDQTGAIRIEPTADLRSEMELNPRFKFAVFDFAEKKPIPGSSPELVATLQKIIEISTEHTHFILPGDPEIPSLGFMEMRRTPFGRMHIATYRQKFRGSDIVYSLTENLRWLGVYVIVTALMSAGTAWIAVRQGLKPLRATVNEAAHIDMNSLGQRLATASVPTEITPLVDAVNEAMNRLAAGVVRQRHFTANAAHELRTPLSMMRARLENAKETSLNNDLLTDASQLRAVVEQMLIAARLTEGQAPLDQDVDLGEVMRESVTNMLPLAMDCDRFIELEESAPPAIVRGNRRAIESVITNLLENALRAEPPGGKVIARALVDGIVVVSDHGEGVAESDRELIFEPFWRKSEATPGTGLGLAIAKEIMDAHGGRIWVEDTPGGGATFKLAFPRSNAI
jgi:signal transduction histidine kinase